jgi:FkbM family methyltransferase
MAQAMSQGVSYAQRFEDLYLLRCFGERMDGFYIDIGSGHPVYDNVSFAFYLKGWRGLTVEPNPWLARLSRAVRPRDRHFEALIGPAAGQATFYVVREFHGLSTTVEEHAKAALREFGKAADAVTVPVMTLRELCEERAPAAFDFLKVDVEGVEKDVLFSGDWQRFRPKLIVVEALAPYTLAPAWDQWEPFLARHGYRYVWFDSLNRYYLAEEAGDLAAHFATAPATFDAFQFRDSGPALGAAAHPDHRLAGLIASTAMMHLPVLDRALVRDFLTAGLTTAELDRQADEADLARIVARLFGPESPIPADLRPPVGASVRALYDALIDTDRFRIACGRISASYGW